MKIRSEGQRQLIEWMRREGLVRADGRPDTRELARRYARQAGPSKGVFGAHKRPPFAGMLALVEGRSNPHWDTRVCIRDFAGVAPEAWDEPPAEGA